ncbi:MAG TPA: FHA domain-containing protein [Myxococcales bacterium]|jgi:pSer/pThr/pTyr-binding forkhead associated (FHA) protein
MPIRLLVKSKAEVGERPPQEVVLNSDSVVLGRDKTCEVVLNDTAVSRRHAQIVREGALYFIEDTGSSFGTRINGSALPAGEKRLLKNGDTVAIGPYDVTFDRIADCAVKDDEKTSFVAKRIVKDALRGLATAGTPYLRVMNGPLEGKRYEIGDAQELVIGREDDVQVILDNDDLVSRRHAKIRRDWSGTAIEDLGSRNGIRVNRKKVATSPLKDRDEVEVGSTRFLFLDPSEVREVAIVEEKPLPKAKPPEPPPKKEPEPEPEPEPEESKEEEPAQEASSGESAKPEEAEEPKSGEAPAESSGESPVGEEPGEGEGEGGGAEAAPEDSPAVSEELPIPEEQSVVSSVGPPPKLASAEGLRRMLPVVIVVGIAIFAVLILLVTFFVV